MSDEHGTSRQEPPEPLDEVCQGIRITTGAAVIALASLTACTDRSDPCPPYQAPLRTVDIVDFGLAGVSVEQRFDAEIIDARLPEGAAVERAMFRLQLDAGYTTRPGVPGASLAAPGRSRWWTDLFIASAYACSPAYDGTPFEAAETLSMLTVTSNTDWDERFPAGTPLNQIVSVQVGVVTRYDTEYRASADAYAPLTSWLDEPRKAPLSLRLRLDEPPTADGLHRFSVSVVLDDGRMSVASSSAVRLVAED